MSKILHLKKSLAAPLADAFLPGITIRTFGLPRDVPAWLALRDEVFGRLVASGRPWTERDLEREFAGKSVWIAEANDAGRSIDAEPSDVVVGAIALGRCGRPPTDRPSLQWLMVAPAHRRRGIGQALIAVVERAAWDAGERELVLETHADWHDALRLYERCGYRKA